MIGGSALVLDLHSDLLSDQILYRLNFQLRQKLCIDGFDRLLSTDELPDLALFDHQIDVVMKVLNEMGGRAILADEVGLGKTIEAGIILKEYILRGMVKSALILVPASLLLQWKDELISKLKIPVVVGSSPGTWNGAVTLASIDTAKKSANAGEIIARDYDILIVDEAHRLKSSTTLNWQFVNSIRKRFLLLLTATPIQNELKELYNMVTLLRPGQLRTFNRFKKEFMLDKRTPKNTSELKRLLAPVLIRHTRRDTGIPFPNRDVRNIAVSMDAANRELYYGILSFVRGNYQAALRANVESGRRLNILPFVLLLREASSSPMAAKKTLSAMLAGQNKPGHETDGYVNSEELPELIRTAENQSYSGKLSALMGCLQAWSGEKTIIFTEFTETALAIKSALAANNIETVYFHGGLSKEEKSRTIGSFRERVRVMVSTEAGGEGHNLQFCHNLINYDLPWNPMRVEQRIGRVHRLGQRRDVRVVNLYFDGTIEAYVLYLLDKKINMFETIVGELDLILSNLGKRTFEGRLADMILASGDDTELRRMVEALGDELEEARLGYERMKHANSLLLD